MHTFLELTKSFSAAAQAIAFLILASAAYDFIFLERRRERGRLVRKKLIWRRDRAMRVALELEQKKSKKWMEMPAWQRRREEMEKWREFSAQQKQQRKEQLRETIRANRRQGQLDRGSEPADLRRDQFLENGNLDFQGSRSREDGGAPAAGREPANSPGGAHVPASPHDQHS